MTVREDEELFVVLHLLKEPEPAYLDELVKLGYLDETHNNTPKAEKFVEEFTKSKVDLIYEAIKKQGRYCKDKGFVMLSAGLKNPIAVEIIMEEMVKRRILKKKYNREYIIRC